MKAFREENTKIIDDTKDFDAFFTPENKDKPEIHGGFALSHWCGSAKCEEDLKELKITIRNIPLNGKPEEGKCINCEEDSHMRVVFAKSY